MVHVPEASMVAVVPETVHTAVEIELNVTGKPELAEAISAIDEPTAWTGILAKVMTCACAFTENVSVTDLAGA